MQSKVRARRDTALRALLAASLSMAAQNSLPVLTAQATGSGIDLLVVASSGEAIPRAKVALTDGSGEKVADGLTDRWGKFSVFQVSPGAYKITATHNGFKNQEKTLLVQQHQITELNLTLQNEVPILPGQELVLDLLQHGDSGIDLIVKDQTDAVISNAKVTIVQVDTGANLEGRTTQRGGFRATGLAAGKYIVWVDQAGFTGLKALAELPAHEHREIAITMQVSPTPIIEDPYRWDEMLVHTIPATLDSELIPESTVAAAPATSSAEPSSGRKSSPFRRFFLGLRHMFRP